MAKHGDTTVPTDTAPDTTAPTDTVPVITLASAASKNKAAKAASGEVTIIAEGMTLSVDGTERLALVLPALADLPEGWQESGYKAKDGTHKGQVKVTIAVPVDAYGVTFGIPFYRAVLGLPMIKA